MNYKEIIDNIIIDKKLSVSYSIYNNKKINKNADKIYPIHSISKLFTNIMLILLINDNIIDNNMLNKPMEFDKNILNKLSNKVINRLKETTMLDNIKHEAGLKDYLDNYHKYLTKCTNKYPNPIEPEDFLEFADIDVMSKDNISKYNYSNLGVLLVALSMKYYYNNKFNTKLTYNQILKKYIINKLKLKTFNICNPKINIIIPLDPNDLTKYINGTPASGYWMSAKDLCKFGMWINNLYNTNNNIKKIIKTYKFDIFWKNPLRLGHWGFLQTSSSTFETYLNKNITVVILSNNNDDAHILMHKIRKIIK